jgi:lactoylglutathione lyase
MAGPEAGVAGFIHAGITVSDMERSLVFYRDLLGLSVVTDRVVPDDYVKQIVGMNPHAIRIAVLSIPGSDASVELLEYRGGDGQPIHPLPGDPGGSHTCFLTTAIHDLDRRLRDAGCAARSTSPVEVPAGPKAGWLAVYFSDPDGHWVELLQGPAA